MARMARVVVPGIPHHVTQRGVRKNDVFFCEEDYLLYIDLLSEFCTKSGTEVWAYCLMTNHVHLVLVPSSEDGLRASLSEAHRRYTLHINQREQCRGHLWQERFHSFPMDEQYLRATVRYVELNPVHAGMVNKGEDYPWSSVRTEIQKHTQTGRPLGQESFLDNLERKVRRSLRPQKRGRKRIDDK